MQHTYTRGTGILKLQSCAHLPGSKSHGAQWEITAKTDSMVIRKWSVYGMILEVLDCKELKEYNCDISSWSLSRHAVQFAFVFVLQDTHFLPYY